jgi:hypothetical protein
MDAATVLLVGFGLGVAVKLALAVAWVLRTGGRRR